MKSSLSWLPIASGMLVLVLSLGLAFVTVTSRGSTGELANSQKLQTQAAVTVPTLSLTPATGEFEFDTTSTYPVGIILDSGGRDVDGADVVITYDPTKVQIVGAKVNPTNVFPEIPLNEVDAQVGKIRFSGLTFNPQPVTGVIGTFSFKPLTAGEVNFQIDYVAGATTDSNVAEHGSAVDVLGGVENARYTFN